MFERPARQRRSLLCSTLQSPLQSLGRFLSLLAAALLLLAGPQAQAQVACTPAVTPSPAIAFQTLTLLANCDPAAGPVTETWTLVCACGGAPIIVPRLPGAPVATTSITSAGGVTVTLSAQPATGPPSVFSFSLTVQTTAVGVPARLASVRSGAAPVAVRGQLQRQLGLAAQRSGQARANRVGAAVKSQESASAGPAVPGQSAASEGSAAQSQDATKEDAAASAASSSSRSSAVQTYAMQGSLRVQQAAAGPFSAYSGNSEDLSLGVDLRMKGPWTVGASLATHKAQMDTGQASTGSQEQRAASVLVYASYAATGHYFVDLALAGQRGRSHLQRQELGGTAQANAPSMPLATLTATTRTQGLGMAIGAGLQRHSGAYTLEFSARAEHMSSRVGAFEESGSLDALAVAAQWARNTTMALGVLGQQAWPTSWGISLAQLRVDWAQAVQSQQSAASAYVISASRSLPPVQSEVAPQQRRQGWIGAGLSAQWPRGVAGFIDFAQGFGTPGLTARRLNLGLKVEL